MIGLTLYTTFEFRKTSDLKSVLKKTRLNQIQNEEGKTNQNTENHAFEKNNKNKNNLIIVTENC